MTEDLMRTHPAHQAAYGGHHQVLALLRAHPDFIKIRDLQGPVNGYTALHNAVWHGSREAARLLLEAGADTAIKGWDGNTALDLARKYGYQDMVELLEKAAAE
jgi:ankyrin repeat protein